jgi:SAM-dependent methyltransferase
MKKIRQLVRGVLHRLPDEGRGIKTTVRRLQMKKEIATANLISRLEGTILPDPYTVYWIDPRRIQFHTNYPADSSDWEDFVFDQNGFVAQVQDGDWDIPLHRVEDMRVCQAMNDRIHHGVSWQTTEYYQHAISRINGGQVLWGCSDGTSFDKRCEEIDRLIESIDRQGYRERSADPAMSARPGDKEILINISRDGLCLFQDGRHRLAIALALGLKRVPVQVLVRHSGWQSFRELMHQMARGNGGASKRGVLYQTPMHFDLVDIPSEHACEDRWEAIKNNLDAAPGNALDIGCNLGFFCHRLEESGYSCIGVEYLPTIALAARKIAYAEDRKLKIVTGDILNSETMAEIGASRFDVLIALNIFHHFIKTRDGYERLRQFMGNLQIGTMFFEPHHPDESQMQGVFINPQQNEFVQLIKDWGGFEKAESIYTAADGRAVFKLEQQRRKGA